jgi:transcriptional regulator with PAS, ATPase and Fis domain
METALRLAPSTCPLLLLGETGTGKEVLARLVHRSSPRAAGPFRAVNCAGLPEGLLEAELFGAARGAYTGAEGGRPGLLEASHGGTLFLDEIGDMAPRLQAALLRVLEDGVTRRLGETAERRTDFRIVAATNREPAALADRGEFRRDLLYRLGRILRLPPLRERGEDVLLLARAFLLEAAGGGAPKVLDAGAEGWLRTHPFPGNVRELRSRVLAAAALSPDGEVRAADLDDEGAALPGAGRPAGEGRREGAEGRLLEALRRIARAPVGRLVRETGLPRRTVQRALAGLVREGGLLRAGRGPATRYRLAGSEDAEGGSAG